MDLNTKLEVAIEIMAAKIASASKKGLTTKDKEMQILLQERENLYSGDEVTINKIIDIYGPEVKSNYEGV